MHDCNWLCTNIPFPPNVEFVEYNVVENFTEVVLQYCYMFFSSSTVMNVILTWRSGRLELSCKFAFHVDDRSCHQPHLRS